MLPVQRFCIPSQTIGRRVLETTHIQLFFEVAHVYFPKRKQWHHRIVYTINWYSVRAICFSFSFVFVEWKSPLKRRLPMVPYWVTKPLLLLCYCCVRAVIFGRVLKELREIQGNRYIIHVINNLWRRDSNWGFLAWTSGPSLMRWLTFRFEDVLWHLTRNWGDSSLLKWSVIHWPLLHHRP